ncbi:50S ribosomal protein L20 [Patescibacteria group bacterium]|nr:50S ribosomal protein L20 [Patescibacteria group bacterium]
MSRVKRGVIANKRRKNVLKYTKGFRWGRKSKERAAKEALLHAWTHAFAGRKQKKRDYRTLWNVRINAAARANGMTYSQLINKLKKANVKLDRKVLADLARLEPAVFAKVVAHAK